MTRSAASTSRCRPGEGAGRGSAVIVVGLLAGLGGACAEQAEAPEAAAGDARPAPPSPGGEGGQRDWPRLSKVMVSNVTPPEERPEEPSLALDGRLRDMLQRPEVFASASSDDPMACGARVRIVYALVKNGEIVREARAGTARMRMEGVVKCPRPSDPSEVETFRVQFRREQSFGDEDEPSASEALEELADRLARRTADTLYGQVVVRHASDEEILEVLEHSQRLGLLMEAASEAGERELTRAIPHLARLTHEHLDDAVALRAGAALGLIGEPLPLALKALAAMTRGTDTERHRVAINALGDLGGPKAARYLDTLAIGHPEASMRELARKALERARTGARGKGASR